MTHSLQLPQSVIQLAQQGDPKAIAAFMNNKLNSVKIKATVRLQDGCLQTLLEADKTLDKSQCLAFVAQVITRLQLRSRTSIKAFAVYGKRTGESNLLWQHQQLLTQPKAETPRVSQAQTSSLTEASTVERASLQSNYSQTADDVMTIESLAIAFAEWEKRQTSKSVGQSMQVQDKPKITSLKQVQSVAGETTVDTLFAYF